MKLIETVQERTWRSLQYYIDNHWFNIKLIGVTAEEAEQDLDNETKNQVLNYIVALTQWWDFNDKTYERALSWTLNNMQWQRIRKSEHQAIAETIFNGKHNKDYIDELLLLGRNLFNPVAIFRWEDEQFPSLVNVNQAFRDKHCWLICNMHGWPYAGWLQWVNRSKLNTYKSIDILETDILKYNRHLYHSLIFILLIQWDLVSKL